MNESFAELFEQSQVTEKMRLGTVVDVKVLDIKPDFIVVDTGFKSEGFIDAEEFYDHDQELEVAVGDTVQVALDSIDDGLGETRVSRRRAKQIASWADLEAAYESGESVFGKICDRIKGGFEVDINEVNAFLPGSQVDVRPIRDISHIEGILVEFKVIKIDRQRNNVMVSRRALLEEHSDEQKDALLDTLKEDVIVKGIVKNLTDYGAFIDLGGVDGLLHITDMAWRRVQSPGEIVSIGDEIDVKVLRHDRERGRISLGLKQMLDDPWEALGTTYPEGTKLTGKVTNMTDYGCFVEIKKGIEGLVHISEMDWTNKNVHPSRLVHLGQEVDVVVLNINGERRRISLGMKQCLPNPWENFAAQYQKGEHISGTVKSITDFGIFIGLKDNIDGLVRLADISWAVAGEEVIRQFNKGDTIETVILSIDIERERISLGIKQLEEDPLLVFIKETPKNSIVSGTVDQILDKYILVKLSDNVLGSLKKNELIDENSFDKKLSVKEGETIEAKIIAVDRGKRFINLSVKEKESDHERAAIEEYANNSNTIPKPTLGSILKDQLKRFKTKEEE